MKPQTWTEERIEKLKKLWADGHSASMIAARLGIESRSAVIGKVHRLKLSRTKMRSRAEQRAAGQAAAYVRKKQRMVEARAKTKEARGDKPATQKQAAKWRLVYDMAVARMEAANDVAKVQLVDLTDGCCRWPIGDPGKPGFGFCGEPKVLGISYCAPHAARAFAASAVNLAAGAQIERGGGVGRVEPKREKTDALEGAE